MGLGYWAVAAEYISLGISAECQKPPRRDLIAYRECEMGSPRSTAEDSGAGLDPWRCPMLPPLGQVRQPRVLRALGPAVEGTWPSIRRSPVRIRQGVRIGGTCARRWDPRQRGMCPLLLEAQDARLSSGTAPVRIRQGVRRLCSSAGRAHD